MIDLSYILVFAGYEAIKSSGLADKVNDNPFRYGALIATGIAGLKSMMENCKQMFNKGLSSTSPFWITNVIPNSASALLTQEYNLQGPSFSTASACASSNHAFGIAINIIKSGVSDAILTGGSESISNRIGISAFGNIFALSKRVDDPTRASRPFDKDRDGFVIGEGSGVLCLEDLEHAKARGAKIYCEITGFGFTTDAYDLVAPHPEARGSSKAMEMAIENAKLNKEDIDLINCHGTSTPMGDFIEALAIHKVFGENAKNIPVHSSKSMIGHLIGASGAAEAIADIQTFEKGIIHPSINVVEQDTRIKLNVVKEAHEQKNVNHILSNSFGFGGHNACVVFSRFKD